jgi:hypothetical protein
VFVDDLARRAPGLAPAGHFSSMAVRPQAAAFVLVGVTKV